MTLSLSDIADTLRWLWLAAGVAWVAYAWLHRVDYARAVGVLVALLALDWLLHTLADFGEAPDSGIPSDFSVYSLMILLGAIVGLSAALWYARRIGLNARRVIDAALIVVIAGGIGGRAYQVWTRWGYYGEAENRDFILDLAQGGMGLRGGLILGLIALLIFALITRTPFWQFADVGALGLSIAQSIGWYGAYATHMHYGIPTDAPLAPTLNAGVFEPLAELVRSFGSRFATDLPDAYGIIALRVPVQLFASAFYLVLFLVLVRLARQQLQKSGFSQRRFVAQKPGLWAGRLFVAYLLLSSLATFLLNFWRGDETLIWNGLRVDQYVDLLGLLIGVILFAVYRWRALDPLRASRMTAQAVNKSL